MADKFVNVDVVLTRSGVRIITDINNVGMERNENKDDYHVSESLSLPSKGRNKLSRTLEQNIGNHVLIKLSGRELTIKKTGEIDSRYKIGDKNSNSLVFREGKADSSKYQSEYKIIGKRSFRNGH